MKKAISPDLIRKYIAGTCTPEEKDAVHNWYASFENDKDPIIDLELKQQLELRMRMLGQIRANIQSSHNNHRQKRNRVFMYGGIVSLAAALIVILGFLLYNVGLIGEKPGKSTLTAGVSKDIIVDNQTQTIQKHTLSDGSTIWLSPMARIEYKKDFDAHKRIVKMVGDAFFDITKDKGRPFIIYGGGVITKVWGTSFSVSTGKDAGDTEVAVLTGKVSVKVEEPGGKELMLLPNQKAVYSKVSHQLSKNNTPSVSKMNIWKKEDFSFDNATVSHVVKVLNEKFEVDITIADEALDQYVLKADFTGQSLPEILFIMSKTLNITYSIDDEKIVLHQIK